MHRITPPSLPELHYHEIDATLAARLGADAGALFAELGIAAPADPRSLEEIVEQTLALYLAAPRPAPWGCFLAVDPARRAVVGTCGYKHGPDADGRVEISYFTFPEFERQGCATAMAGYLLQRAGETPLRPIVRAHTLSETNSSARILERLRFRRLGTVIDPDDGPVWRWERVPPR